MPLMDTIRGWVERDREKLTYLAIDPSHVKGTYSSEPVVAGAAYFRIVMAEAFLKKRAALFKTLHPAVHAVVRLTFGDQVVEVPAIADSTKVVAQETPKGDVIMRNYPLTPRVPFNGGTVDLSAGLIALQGENQLKSFMKVMGDFAGVLAAPQLSAVLAIAEPLAGGIQDLFGAGQSDLHLGLYDSFEGKGDADDEVTHFLRAGFRAVIRAPEKDLDVDSLWVVDGTLRTGPSVENNQPFEQVDHILFQITTREERDDWEALSDIRDARTKMRQALSAAAEEPDEPLFMARARKALTLARLAVKESPDLTSADRTRVIERLNAEFAKTEQEITAFGLVADERVSFQQLMAGAMSVEQALERGEPTMDEIWAD